MNAPEPFGRVEYRPGMGQSRVEDNMIGYPQDKKTREFTFVFYLNTARLHLERQAI